MGNKKSWFSVDKETISLKATLFLFYGGMYALLPYLTVHMVEVGLSIEEIGAIYAALPFASFAGPPIAGAIADYIGNYKLVLYTSLFLNGLFYTLLLLVDAKGSPSMNNLTPATLRCFQNTTTLTWNTCDGDCVPTEEMNITILLDTCQEECPGTAKISCTGCSRNETGLLVLTENAGHVNGTCSGVIVPKFEGLEEFYCDCSTTCSAMLAHRNCSRNGIIQTDDKIHHPYFDDSVHKRGFWMYFVLRTLATIFTGINFSMLDSTTLCKVRETGGQYGRQRLWATLGSAVASPVTGGLVDLISTWRGFADYSITFYISDILLVCTIISLLRVDLVIDKPEGTFFKNVKQLIRLPDADVFIVMMLILGSMWGFIESFLFIFLKELNSPTYLLGLTVTVSCVAGLPFMYCSKWVMDKVGEINLIIIAFFTYAVRLVGYSFINNPWLCFPYEALEIITQHLMTTASATYCAMTAPVGLLATMNGLVGGAHYNIGRGAGSYLGGFFISEYGLRTTFQIMGVIAAAGGVLYTLLHLGWLRSVENRRIKKEQEKRRVETRLQARRNVQGLSYSVIETANSDFL